MDKRPDRPHSTTPVDNQESTEGQPPEAAGDEPANSPGSDDGKSKDMRHMVHSAAVNTLALLAGTSLTVFYTLAARVFGKAIYGLYSFTFAAIEILMTIGGMATDKGLVRFIAAHHVVGETDREASALGTGFWLTAIVSSCAALGAFLFAGPLASYFGKPEAAEAIRLLAPSILFGELLAIMTWATIAAKVMRYKLYVKEAGFPMLLMLCALPLGLVYTNLQTLCVGHIVASFFAVIWIFWAVSKVYRHLPFSRALRAPLHWEMIRFCIPMAMTDPLGVLVQRASTLIIGKFVTSAQIGVFAAADNLSRAIGGATMAFDPVIMQVLAEATKLGDKKRMGDNLRLTSRWVAIICIPIIIFFVLFRRELMLLFGRGFVEGAQTLLIFTGGRLVAAILGLSAWVLPMSGRAKTVMVNQTVVAIVSVFACYYLTSQYGIEGAALSWTLSMVLFCCMIVVEVYLFEQAHPFSLGMLKVVLAGVATLVVMWKLTALLPETIILRLVSSSVGTLSIYGTLFILFGRTPEDDQLLRILKLKK